MSYVYVIGFGERGEGHDAIGVTGSPSAARKLAGEHASEVLAWAGPESGDYLAVLENGIDEYTITRHVIIGYIE